MGIPKRFSYLLFGLIQSGFTCAIAAAIASAPFVHEGGFLGHWGRSWLLAWVTMVPFVIIATPFIRRAVDRLTTERI